MPNLVAISQATTEINRGAESAPPPQTLSVSNHPGQKGLKQLATEIYKTIHHENPRFMEEIFSINESPYNLRGVTFAGNKPNAAVYGLETISFRCQEVWNSIPIEITSSPNINIFKASIKNLSIISCSCRICKPFIGQIGYIDTLANLYALLWWIRHTEAGYYA